MRRRPPSEPSPYFALTDVAPETASQPIATPAYERFLLDGAREHGLPTRHIAELGRLPERPGRSDLS